MFEMKNYTQRAVMKTLVCTLLSKNTLFLLCLLSISTSYGQVLTITSSGNTGTSGTNWSISGNTLTVTGTASIQASVIENHLTFTGPLTIVGNTTNLIVQVFEEISVLSGSNSLVIGASGNQGGIVNSQPISLPGSISLHGGNVSLENNVVTTGSGAKILVKTNEAATPVNATDGFIVLTSGKLLTTSGGDIILWSNATNKTSGQANNEIILLGSNTLSTSGGKIVLAGGLDNGSNGGTASDGIPDGYAYRGGYASEAVKIGSNVILNSGGGEIIIRGEQNGYDAAVGAGATFTISNGGAVTIEGKNITATSVALGTANITGSFQLLGGTLALDNNITCTNIELSGTATLANGKYISASGNMTNNGTLNLSASSSGYSQLKVGGTITNSGTISQSQYIGSTGHHGISSPMTSGFTTTSGTSSTLFGYNATTGAWDWSPTTSTVGAGFFAPVQASSGFQSAAGTFSVTGTPNTSHTHSLGYAANTATGGSGSGWNLIGNPYTCGLDWTSVTKTNVNNAYYVWDASNGTYQYYSGSALTGTYLAASSILSGVIPPMQAFWVQATASGGSIVSTMASDGTVASSPTFYKTSPDNLILYAEDLNDPSLSDAMWITHAAGYTKDFEGDQDAWKRTNYGGQANIYSYHDGEKLAINAMDLSSTTSIPVGVGAPEAGRKYRIVLEQLVNNQAYQVVLEDKLMNSFTDITSEGYVFTYGPWQNEEPRFVLHINQSTVGIGEESLQSPKLYQQGDRLIIQGNAQEHGRYSLVTLDGRQVAEGVLQAGMANIEAPMAGVYILQITGAQSVAQRVIVQ